MRRSTPIFLLAVAACLTAVCVAAAEVRVGEMAPGFTRTDLEGTTHSLNAYRGQTVLLALVGYG